MRMETDMAKASLDNVALRDPKATDHKTSMADLQKITPRYDWTAAFRALDVKPGDVNVAEPKFLAEVNRQLGAVPVADWKTYLDWQLLDSASPVALEAVRRRELRLQRRLSSRARRK